MMKDTQQVYRNEAFIADAMDKWGSSVFKLAFAQTTSKADAEDVFQEVFLRLLKNKSSFNGEEHLKAWLLRVTLNCCHDLARSAWKRRVVGVDAVEEPAYEESAISREAMRDLAQALDTLPDDMRAVVHLYYYEGYSTEEIAKITDVEASTIRSRLQRARGRLKSWLGGVGYGTYECVYEQDGSGGNTYLFEG
ncbi:MAG: sigma-70 family RNA polymerase sigma factor [Eggerthellaceae bacterium]|nr:sigma-70 family RNA polymerase sigma factor [Eggerthellaceae bacterium]